MATLLATLAVTTAQAGDQGFAVKASRDGGAPFKDILKLNLKKGEKRSVYVRVKNTGSIDRMIEMTGPSAQDGYKYKYFDDGENVTTEFSTTGYPVNLGEGEKREFKMRLKRAQESANDDCPTVFGLDAKHAASDSAIIAINTNCEI